MVNWDTKTDASPLMYAMASLIVIIALVFPRQALQSELLKSVLSGLTALLPKLQSDYGIVSRRVGEGWADRYLLSYALSLVAFLPLIGYCIYFAGIGSTGARKRPLQCDPIRLLLRTICVLFFAYFAFFDLLIASSDARMSKVIFRSPMCIIWAPLVFLALTNAVQLTAQNAKVLLKPKLP